MKVGLSLSRCVVDIFEKRVSMDQILVIVARTNFDPENDDQWNNVWKGYAGDGSFHGFVHPEWIGYQNHQQDFRKICIDLKLGGRLHQPRQYGAHVVRLPYHWYDLILTETVVDNNPAAKKAWENYKLIAGLS
jgi:cytochrome oxidase Cu insertion factor (SCO1/SenC/PrrC family)